jgi:hypothetical protein
MRSCHSVVCIVRLTGNPLEPSRPARHRPWDSSVSLGWPAGSAQCRSARSRRIVPTNQRSEG